MILIDYSQICITTLMGFLKGDTESPIDMRIFRSLILNRLLEFRQKYHKRFGELVICTDGNDYWRRKNFPHYKGTRKKAKQDSGYDWKQIEFCKLTLQEELRRFFPYAVVSAPCAEADDSIAILTEWSQTHDLVDGLFESPRDTIIISGDEDFIQLHKYKNIKQFSLMTRKQIVSDVPLDQFCIEHVLTGDSSDGIPNILSPLDFFYQNEISDVPMRQKPCTAKIKQYYYDQVKEHGKIIQFRSEDEEKRFRENEKLILFDHIPEYLKEEVLASFHSQQGKSRKNVMNYLVAAKLKNLIIEAQEF
jgi:hypothetical protein